MAEEDESRNHWWWRPGWQRGRSFYTWHIVFDDQPSVHRLAERVRPLLAGLPVLDPIPPKWLHLTMQGVGFTDKVDSADLQEIRDAAMAQLAQLNPFTITLGPIRVDAEGAYLPVHPAETVATVRAAIRDAIGDLWGIERVPEPSDGFTPHVTLAYMNTSGALLAPIRTALGRSEVVTVRIRQAALITLNRDQDMYQWNTVSTVPLGRSEPAGI